jgi:hypothetical protein
MEKEQIRPFLYRVATDSAYRNQLETNPVDTLAELDVIVDPDDVPPNGIQLPSNEEILATLDDLVAQFENLRCENWELWLIWKTY